MIVDFLVEPTSLGRTAGEALVRDDIFLNTALGGDYTGKIQIACYSDGTLEFYNTKSQQEIEPYGNCPTQAKVTNLVAQCKENGNAYITWTKPQDAFVYDIFRYKNNVVETYFTTKDTYFTDKINSCAANYSYGVQAVSKCLGTSQEVKIDCIPYEAPCPTPTCTINLS